MRPLPSEFTALYRLFLRATSAAVLHNGPATRGLRRMYRPTSEAAASVFRRLESVAPGSSEAESAERWMSAFDDRVNNTLMLLHISAHSRGLPHSVVSRLFLLSRSNYSWNKFRRALNTRTWLPNLDRNSPEYTTMRPSAYSSVARKNAGKRRVEEEESEKMWGALGECISMAEGRDGLIYGKAQFQAQKIRKRKFF
ncbi:uncharacterized protein FOMMEDRAFT_74698 [Fomitiporia mediterranea MF3/22]|uniref:uncharacterized protein n=1 Tax=Fomitiporia mediterranea (strain MF3/22) TaxID=694068 RepID=UPI000440873F|nr:uncharacterized protein FOMMEDRAFT_74698 [Fomitiporia mediterranea MF3/22]EJD08299.1 hypothetical protein FOMMEDRAFT_74698 [Fomitiporia mediterranea MF3/22]